jgi:thiamine biosynthesis lipoprotein
MIVKLEFRAMGCQMLAAIDHRSAQARRWLERAPGWFEAWEDSLSRFRPDSELSRLNRSPGEEVPVSRTLWEVFQASLEAEEQSQGLVTPTILETLVSAGYDRSFDQLPSEQAAKATAHTARWMPARTIRLRPDRQTMRLPAGVRLDFGGIAKGWAAHQAMRRLQGYGPALVDAGGDIAISSLRLDGRPWLVGIDDPLHPGQSLGALALGRCGVATSGRDYRRWKQEGAWKHHIIDPRSGAPAETDVLSATVIAPTVMEAEMAAKTALILGSQQGLGWLAIQPAFAGLLVLEDGRILCGDNFEKYWWKERV